MNRVRPRAGRVQCSVGRSGNRSTSVANGLAVLGVLEDLGRRIDVNVVVDYGPQGLGRDITQILPKSMALLGLCLMTCPRSDNL